MRHLCWTLKEGMQISVILRVKWFSPSHQSNPVCAFKLWCVSLSIQVTNAANKAFVRLDWWPFSSLNRVFDQVAIRLVSPERSILLERWRRLEWPSQGWCVNGPARLAIIEIWLVEYLFLLGFMVTRVEFESPDIGSSVAAANCLQKVSFSYTLVKICNIGTEHMSANVPNSRSCRGCRTNTNFSVSTSSLNFL